MLEQYRELKKFKLIGKAKKAFQRKLNHINMFVLFNMLLKLNHYFLFKIVKTKPL